MESLKNVRLEDSVFLLKIDSDQAVSAGKFAEHQNYWGENQENVKKNLFK